MSGSPAKDFHTQTKSAVKSQRQKTLFISFCLAAAVIAVYWPVFTFDFINYDDDVYVVNNPHIKTGFNIDAICWAFTTGYAKNWHPLTWLSLVLDYQLFKDWPGGYHLVNLTYHIVNTLLLFGLFKYLTGDLWPSAFIAAAFALHPMHVESVVWIAERKDVLSTFFWLLAMWAYAKYANDSLLLAYGHGHGSDTVKWFFVSLAFFIFGLMSKPMLVTLPFVLLLLDYWPLKRNIGKSLILEKLPFFFFTVVSCAVTYIVQQKGGAVVDFENITLRMRVENAVVSYAAYVFKMLWPAQLAVLYTYTAHSVLKVLVSFSLLLLLTAACVCFGRRYRFLAVGWLWYLGTLVPVIGLVQVGQQSMADRYTYMPFTGLFMAAAYSIKEFVCGRREKKMVLALTALIVIGFWPLMTLRQVRYWKDSITLFKHTLAVTENNYAIHTNYITSLNTLGRYADVVEESEKFLKNKPDSIEVLNNIGIALGQMGRVDEAAEYFRKAIHCCPQNPLAYFNLATVLLIQNKPQEAAEVYKQLLQIDPNNAEAQMKINEIMRKSTQ